LRKVKPPVRDTVTTTSCLDGRFPRLIDKLTRVPLLILDDFGTHNRPAALLPVRNHREERHRRKSTPITARRRHSRQDRSTTLIASTACASNKRRPS
jgi:hypothetical protein